MRRWNLQKERLASHRTQDFKFYLPLPIGKRNLQCRIEIQSAVQSGGA